MTPRAFLFIALSFFAGVTLAQSVPQMVQDRAAELIPDRLPDSVVATPVAGLYEVTFGTQVVYLFEDGQHLLSGDLIDLDRGTNLTEDARKVGRKAVINGLDEAGMVVFSPSETISSITVFTDTECGYCVRLHNEIDQLLAAGVEVRYLGYPRAGVQSPSFDTLVSVWCSDDPQQAMTDAKSGRTVEPRSCKTDIARHMEAAEGVGVRGTPTIVLQDGKTIPGYVPAGELIPMAHAAASAIN
ncbi:MAG: DsbC family protein [Proteobacteria bacterium]|jgi:thiol:disulfide interchange protein DsbC|nr:DsbC family protein [Pseudomonadota bacterium]MBT5817660.1 DsbC family protein [Pseudomonadota bacterium]MBT6350395.1 DsbC family protein [Pseudomonadota bacterium]